MDTVGTSGKNSRNSFSMLSHLVSTLKRSISGLICRTEYVPIRKIAQRTFAAVIEIHDETSDAHDARKPVVQDPNYKNREVDILRRLDHPPAPVVFHSIRRDSYLHSVTDMFQTDFSDFIRANLPIPIVKMFGYEVSAAYRTPIQWTFATGT